MWIKPMFSTTMNDNSVQDGNWEDFFKLSYNWRFQTYTPKDALYAISAEAFQTNRTFNELLRIYFSGEGEPKHGSMLDVQLFLTPLQWLYLNYCMGPYSVNSVGDGVGWFKQRALLFNCYTDVARAGDQGWSDLHWKVPYSDPVEIRPKEIWGDEDTNSTLTLEQYKPEFRDGEWTHIAVVILPEQVAYYINGVQANRWDISAWIGFKLPNDKVVGPYCNFGLDRIELPDAPSTVDEIKVYTKVTSENLGRDQMLRDFTAGRYYDRGSYVSPLLHLPKGSKMQGINWTEFFPKTLDPNGTRITVKLLDPQGTLLRELRHGINVDALNLPMTDFRLKIEMDAAPKPVELQPGVPQPACLVDTPVVDDITIYYTVQEEVLLWELVE
jgi:hypothetical protein